MITLVSLKKGKVMRCLLLVLLGWVGTVQAETVSQMLVELNRKMTDPASYRTAVEQGRQRAELCGYCHGIDGNSVREQIPNLAQQNARYLLTQFEYFGNGTRNDFVMAALVKKLSVDERVNLALYFSTQTAARRSSLSPELAAQGKIYYAKHCVACHGKDGHGRDEMPRVAGQPQQYIRSTLLAYKAGSDRRPRSAMLSIAPKLSKQDIDALAAYVTGMP